MRRICTLALCSALLLGPLGALAEGQAGQVQPGRPGEMPEREEPGIVTSQAAARARERYQRGWELYRKMQLDQAIIAYNQAIAIDPESTAAYHRRGLAYWKKGDYRRAVEDYGKVIQLNPDNALAYYHRAVSRLEMGMWDEALADVEQYIRRQPDDPEGPKLRQHIGRLRAGRGGKKK